MPKDDQGTKGELRSEFVEIKEEGALRTWESENRERLLKAGYAVLRDFDEHWKSVTGGYYLQPVTTIPAQYPTNGQNNVERSDPQSRQYRAKVTFNTIGWRKLRRKIGKRFVDLFILQGVTDSGHSRPIFQNLTADRLRNILGDVNAEKIIKDAKADETGEITGKFPLLVEGYWEVVFAPAKSDSDTVDVAITWEGQCLLIKRQVPVVLPGFYLEVADHTTRDRYTQQPGEGRKKVGTVQEYPYTTLREASMDEYLAQKAAGDKIMREKIIREG